MCVWSHLCKGVSQDPLYWGFINQTHTCRKRPKFVYVTKPYGLWKLPLYWGFVLLPCPPKISDLLLMVITALFPNILRPTCQLAQHWADWLPSTVHRGLYSSWYSYINIIQLSLSRYCTLSHTEQHYHRHISAPRTHCNLQPIDAWSLFYSL